MALSTARMHRVRGRPPLLAAGINSLIHSHSSSVRSLGYIFSLIYLFYTTPEDFSDRLLERCRYRVPEEMRIHPLGDLCLLRCFLHHVLDKPRHHILAASGHLSRPVFSG